MIAKIIGVSSFILVILVFILEILVIIYDMSHDYKIYDKYGYWFWWIFIGLILYMVFFYMVFLVLM